MINIMPTVYKITDTSSLEELDVQMRGCNLITRALVGNILAFHIQEQLDKEGIHRSNFELESTLENFVIEGALPIGGIPEIFLNQVLEYLKTVPLYNGHVYKYSSRIPLLDRHITTPQASVILRNTIEAPYLLEFAMSEKVIAIVEKYLGCVPTLYSLNIMYTMPGKEAPDWHRDYDGFKFLTLFLFLTTHKDGEHQLQIGTHLSDASVGISSITPTAGEAFLEDAYGIHRGRKVEGDMPRIVFWARYGIYDNGFSKDVGEPINYWPTNVPDTKKNRYILRSLVEA